MPTPTPRSLPLAAAFVSVLCAAPAASAQLEAVTVTTDSIRFRWTTPWRTDEGTAYLSGRIFRWTDPDLFTGSVDSGIDTNAAMPTLAEGMIQEAEVVGLAEGTTHHFILAIYWLEVEPDPVELIGVDSENLLEVPTLPDTIPPGIVGGLRVDVIFDTSIALAWTATGDDGNSGRATQYDIRYSRVPITPATFNAATPATGTITPAESGQAELFTVRGLDSRTDYSFAIRTADNNILWGAVSPGVQATTLGAPPGGPGGDESGCSQGAWGWDLWRLWPLFAAVFIVVVTRRHHSRPSK